MSLKSILHNEYLPEAIFDESFFWIMAKKSQGIHVRYNQKVSIHNKNSWQEVMVFNSKMDLFESFFNEYMDIINPNV